MTDIPGKDEDNASGSGGTEDRTLSLEDINSVAIAGLRGSAFAEISDELIVSIDAVVSAYDKIDLALEAANSLDRSSASDTPFPEDFTVVDVAKAYAEAEAKFLNLMHGYLSYAAAFSLADLLSDEAGFPSAPPSSPAGGISGLLPPGL